MQNWILAVLLVLTAGTICLAQDEPTPRFDAGVVLTALDLRYTAGEKPFGIGGRFGYSVTKYLAVESEVNCFPQNPSGNFGETEALFGVKAGHRFNNFGLFAKARPGFVHFGGDSFRVYNGSSPTFAAVDLGGVIEFYPHNRFAVRSDFGDTIIAFGDRQIRTGAIQPYSGGTKHNFQASIGLVFRF